MTAHGRALEDELGRMGAAHLVRHHVPFNPSVVSDPPEHGRDVLMGHLTVGERAQQCPAL
jgi:hypothetical protein